MSPLIGPAPTHHPEEKSLAVKRGGFIKRSGVCVSVSALRATTTPAHPAISLVRHRVRFASTSAALRSTAPAALKRFQERSGTARYASAFLLFRGKPHLRPLASGPSFPSVCLRQSFTPFSPKLS